MDSAPIITGVSRKIGIPSNPSGLIQSLRREVYDSQDYIEGIQAFLEKRAPNFTGQ